MTAWTREHCRCIEVQNLGYEEAASRLGIKPAWLQDHLARIPHMKFGKNPAVFCPCDLRVICQMQAVIPAEAQAVIRPPAATTAPQTPAPAYAALRPSGGRKRSPARV